VGGHDKRQPSQQAHPQSVVQWRMYSVFCYHANYLMPKPTGPLPNPNPDRLTQLEARVGFAEAQVRQLAQIIKGDPELHLPALMNVAATTESLEERIERLEGVVATLKESLESKKDPPDAQQKEATALEQFLMRNKAYVELFTALGVALAAVASVVGAARGQPPTITGGP